MHQHMLAMPVERGQHARQADDLGPRADHGHDFEFFHWDIRTVESGSSRVGLRDKILDSFVDSREVRSVLYQLVEGLKQFVRIVLIFVTDQIAKFSEFLPFLPTVKDPKLFHQRKNCSERGGSAFLFNGDASHGLADLLLIRGKSGREGGDRLALVRRHSGNIAQLYLPERRSHLSSGVLQVGLHASQVAELFVNDPEVFGHFKRTPVDLAMR
ncbi:hypothetical protein ebA5929 [Aromatoleum aromaticum EbN1]|uniref:Uncharacterized protein n=1 Tax=Aromatoleum aromaticum (strain DSM 19018 / LMG 30748 / EbN1) TaxID=76114 RepID=Q5NZL6_AROAE|nr:hypothetical protein ebA5929 [Aromatoleum aromaticum EbN1]